MTQERPVTNGTTPPAEEPHRIFRPLSEERREIRVLHILSRGEFAGREPEQIPCRLETVSLLDNPEYEAVSWCWGDSSQRRGIILDGKVFEVSKNAEEVLRHLCYRHGHHVVWLDAVCINQADLNERGHQVSMMRDVYSMAKRTLVWLGLDDGCARSAFESLGIMYEHCMEETSRNFDETFWNKSGAVVFSSSSLPRCDWQAVRNFFEVDWFSRLWAVQEVLLSGESLCYRGDKSRSWSRISLAAQWMYYRTYWRREYCNRVIPGLDSASRMWRLGARSTDLASLLDMSIDKKASVGLDKIYGLLGLIDFMSQDEIAAAGLAPDYNADLIDIYRNAIKLAILQEAGRTDQLDLLQFAQALVPPRDQIVTGYAGGEQWRPSWVSRVDWVFEPDNGSPSYTRQFGAGAADGLVGDVSFPDQEPDVMQVKGIVVDRVSAVSKAWDHDLLFEGEVLLAQEVLRFRSLAAGVGKSDEDVAVTMACGRDGDGRQIEKGSAVFTCFEDFASECEGIVKHSKSKSEETISNGRGLQSTLPDVNFRDLMWVSACNRHFFVSATGHIGMGPPGIEEGDVVVILFGSVLPFVLRPDGDRWRLLGTAYCHNITEGELIRQLKAGGRFKESCRYFEIH